MKFECCKNADEIRYYYYKFHNKMGCSSSIDFYEPKIFENKTLIWFLGGGPGAPKQQ